MTAAPHTRTQSKTKLPVRRGRIFILSSPSGGGKTTLARRLLRTDRGLTLSISHTSRPPRPGERAGRDYYFVTPKEFLEMRRGGGFAEWVRLHGHYYGTSRAELDRLSAEGLDILMDVDTRGAAAISRLYPGAVTIFILPPSLPELARRLQGRSTEGKEQLRRRLEAAAREIRAAVRFDYAIVNDDLARAGRELRAVVTAERLRLPRPALRALVKEVLSG